MTALLKRIKSPIIRAIILSTAVAYGLFLLWSLPLLLIKVAFQYYFYLFAVATALWAFFFLNFRRKIRAYADKKKQASWRDSVIFEFPSGLRPFENRRFSPMPKSLARQLDQTPHTDYPYEYLPFRPASAVMKDGSVHPCVEFIGRGAAKHLFLAEPGSPWTIKVEDIKSVKQSPYQLPPKFASVLHRYGETSMGQTSFVLTMKDGKRFNYVNTKCLDFVNYPEGYSADDIAGIEWGGLFDSNFYDKEWKLRNPGPILNSPDFKWCFYEEPEKIQRIIAEDNEAKVKAVKMEMQRTLETTKQKVKDAKPLPEWILNKLIAIPHTAFPLEYMPFYPASVTLKDGHVYPCVIFFGVEARYKTGPSFPVSWINPEDIQDVAPSPNQLPPKFASLLWEHCTSFHGATYFILTMKDGKQFNCVSFQLEVDFINYPDGYGADDIAGIAWGANHAKIQNKNKGSFLHNPGVHWCLYKEPEGIRERAVKEMREKSEIYKKMENDRLRALGLHVPERINQDEA
jgi:hypothetical protein